MSTCEVCGNDYDKALWISVEGGDTHVFDSFECAMHVLAPSCAHCGVRIIGHGFEADGAFYCCKHCASREGVKAFEDRA